MSALSFLNPAYLAGLGLASIPILIHLIRRRRVRVVPWAAWDFLLQSRKRNRRRFRIEQLLLLLLRVAIVCLVVLALCRPVFRTLGLPLIAADARVHALIALDNSFSMGYRRSGVSDFDRARQIADGLLSTVLKEGDSVQIVLLSSRPQALIKEPTFSLPRARERLRGAKLSDFGTDYGAGAALCSELLRKSASPTREVYWITDSQKGGFPDAARQRAQSAWKELAGAARVTWIDAGERDRPNLSVDPPVFSRELVTPRAPVRIEATVHNWGPTARNGQLVNLVVDGHPAGATRIDVPAHGKASAEFVYLFEKAGAHSGAIQLAQDDMLARDDSAYFAARVREKLNVLILDSHPSADPAKDDAFYLSMALAPGGASSGSSTAVQPTVHAGPHVSGISLRGYDAIVVAGIDGLNSDDARALSDYVNGGGGLFLFPSRDAGPARAAASLASVGLMPARFGARHVLPEDGAITLNAATVVGEALAPFQDSTEIDLGSGRFTLAYDLAPEVGGDPSRVLCRFSSGQPAFVERQVGQGKVILAASSAGASGGSLPFKAAYVPLVHQLTAYLAAGPSGDRILRVGEPFSARFGVTTANQAIRVTDPAGATNLQKGILGPQGVAFSFASTSRAGVYLAGPASSPRAEAFAVNLPAGESDLTTMDERQIRAAIAPARIQYARAGEPLSQIVRQARQGTEVWRTLVLAALSLLFLEALLTQRFGRRG